jgi:hypothetical protein
MPNVIVTGLPRSGVTLAAALIDSLPNAVCLNSPVWQTTQARRMRETVAFCKWLAGDFIWLRNRLVKSLPIKDYRAPDGSALLDSMDERLLKDENGEPVASAFLREGLHDDFILGAKQDALFTCLLPAIVEISCFKIIAVIRHPFDVIDEWQAYPETQMGKGHLPFAAHYWQAAALQNPEQPIDLLDRMVQLYDLFIQRYHEFSAHVQIIRYEDYVADPTLISQLFGIQTAPPLANKIIRKKPIRDEKGVEALRARFAKYGTFTRYYYPVL